MQVLQVLRRLGLRSVASAEDVLKAANAVAEIQDEASQIQQGRALIGQLGKIAEEGGTQPCVCGTDVIKVFNELSC